MAISFDPTNRRIILDSSSASATELYSRWVDWAVQSDNLKYAAVFRQVGGDDLGGGLSIPPYYFLQAGWRVRPMEADHDLSIDGNLFVEGGGVPVVKTLGTFQVNVKYTVPVLAQGISTSGGSGATAAEIAAEVRLALAAELTKMTQLAALHGLGATLVVSESTRTAGSIVQSISTVNNVTTIATQ